MKLITLDDVIQRELKDPEFKKLYEAEQLKNKKAREKVAKKILKGYQ